MKVLFTKHFFEKDIEYIKNQLNDKILLIFPNSYNEKGLLEHAMKADVLFGNFFSRRIINRAKNLKFIQIPWTGVDNIDLELLKEYNVKLCNSHSNAKDVAEHAISLMMAAAKKNPIPRSFIPRREMEQGKN